MKTLYLLAATLGAFVSTPAIGKTADTIYHNGSILTMAGDQPA